MYKYSKGGVCVCMEDESVYVEFKSYILSKSEYLAWLRMSVKFNPPDS